MRNVIIDRKDIVFLAALYGWQDWEHVDEAILYEDGTVYTNTYKEPCPWGYVEKEDVEYYFSKKEMPCGK